MAKLSTVGGNSRACFMPSYAKLLAASLVLSLAFTCLAKPTYAANYVFDVLYFGQNVATLAPGSDDPNVTSLVDGDTFQWTIAAQDGAHWLVQMGGDFFPLMALLTDPSGTRTGDFDLQLLNNGSEVFSLSETGADNSFIHIGTNTVTLSDGLAFDEMRLDYALVVATGDFGQPIQSDLSGLLPIFGAPENNSFSPGIVYVVPEPTVLSLIGFLGSAALITRRNGRA